MSTLPDYRDPVDLLTSTGLASSRREARDFVAQGSVTINGAKVDTQTVIDESHLLHGDTLLVRRGKKLWHITRWT